MSEAKSILRINLDRSTKDTLALIGKRRGMRQNVLVSRLVAWFAKQEAPVQSAIVGGMENDVAGTLIKLWLKDAKTLEKTAKTSV